MPNTLWSQHLEVLLAKLFVSQRLFKALHDPNELTLAGTTLAQTIRTIRIAGVGIFSISCSILLTFPVIINNLD